MESRCYGCAVKFTLFKKEYGCKNCGRAFCSGCLSFSAAVPRAGNTQQKVCKQCHEVLTRGSSPANASKWSPPQNYKKRVAALEAKQKPSTPQSHGLTQQDQVIAERLARLRQENKPKSVPSQAEIEARLVALRDAPQGSIPSTQEMEARLAALQGRVPPSQTPQLPPLSRTTSTRGAQGPRAPAARDRPPGPWRRRRGGCWLRQQSHFRRRTQGRSGSWPSPSAWPCCRDGIPIEVEAGEQPLIHVHWAVLPTLTLRPNCTVAVLPARLSQGLGVPVPRGLSSSTQNHEEGAGAKQWMRNKWQPSGGRGPWVPSVTLQDYRLPDSDDEEDEETAIQRVLQQLTEEAALDEASGFNIPAEPTLQPQAQSCRAEPEVQAVAARPEAEEEELPWCCICNEDATLRCASCDGDLYCVRCFREGHDAFELKEHQTSAYHPQHKSREH
ncbi:abscission/NoCut checkpoint regulator isoform X1 [Eubalaena glacialis]|uniref:abscission/NoCut checkpoint regulator isoform X1 n=1 Tax=Eubalaena glacialis TaxID=27606 RepID=UPI002A5A8879|nr:abscission/NoCut checkpoint regulator isoform X1 [Eubalaena glacialis]